MRADLEEMYQGKLPKVTTMRFADTRSVFIYDGNALPSYSAQQLGLESSLSDKHSQWGISKQRLQELAKLDHDVVLYFEPFPYKDKLAKSKLWQAMPFVQTKSVNNVDATWSYGGAMSILYNARAIKESLAALHQQQTH